MKLLFLTTYNVSIDREHYFTINVWNELCKQFGSGADEIIMATIIVDSQYTESLITKEELCGKKYYKLHYSPLLSDEDKIDKIASFFKHIAPDIIHSNMIEMIDVKAAKACNIPILLTIHIGGFICPRSGGNGFLKYNDNICDTKVGKHCFRCCSKDFPLPLFARLLYRLLPLGLWERLYHKLHGHQIFYLTLFLTKVHEINLRQKAVEIYKYATIIAANHKLKELLELNGLRDNIVLLPHGVKHRPKHLVPEVRDVVKFFYLGRIQYAKGLHNTLKAFENIDHSLYELHIIGNAESSGISRRYDKRIRNMAKGKNVIFHGRLPHDDIEKVVKDMHVMIHPTICLEVYGLSIAESLSIGRPVLATRCGGAEMQIQEGVNGWFVEPNNIKALHDKILDIIHNKKQITTISDNCKLPHEISGYCKELIGIYKKTITKDKV